MNENQRERLINLLIDGLDDLYDQTYDDRQQAAEVWLTRFFFAASLAMEGTSLEAPLADAVGALQGIGRTAGSPKDRGKAALAATDALRLTLGASL